MSHEEDQEPDGIDASDGHEGGRSEPDQDVRGRRRRDRIRTGCAIVLAVVALWQAVRNGV